MKKPWFQIHIYFTGPFHRQTFLVDSYSKWLEVTLMKSTAAEAVIRTLHKMLVTHRLLDVLVSDNGPQFTATQFKLFLASQGIRHALIAPFHLASNRQAEKMVRTTKEAQAQMGPRDCQVRITRYLLTQHSTPSTTMNHSPAELLMGCHLRTNLDRLHPDYSAEASIDSAKQAQTLTKGDQCMPTTTWATPSGCRPK